MAINERLIDTAVAAADSDTGEEGLILHLDANDVDSYDGDGDEWVDITDHEYTPTTNVSEHFNTVIYDGQSTDLSVTGVGFTPDLVWIKCRDVANSHVLSDSVRGGDGTRQYFLMTDNANAQSSTNQIETIDTDGFTVFGDRSAANRAGQEYVAWCFKAGGAAVLNQEGDIDSQVSANNDLGFSIVSWSGDGSDMDIGHGLDVAPEMIIRKNLISSVDWMVDTSAIDGSWDYLKLNTNATKINHTFVQSPTSTIFNTMGANYNSSSMIAYCFASKRGVSKVGSYTGSSGAVDVQTGFEPAFVMIKWTSGSINYGGWCIYDNKRDATSPNSKLLQANANSQELDNVSYSITMTSTGFTVGSTQNDAINYNGNKYIYYAVAKNTNETSLIPDTDLEINLDAGDTNSTPTVWKDLSANNYSSTFTGITHDKELGNYYNFTGGNSEVEIGTSGQTAYITNGGEFTISMWVNIENNNNYQNLWTNMNNSAGKRQIYARITSDDKIEVTAYPTGSDSNNYRQVFSTATVANDIYGKWSYLTFVVTARKISAIYINSEPIALSVASGSSLLMNTAATDNLYIGGSEVAGTAISLNGSVGQFLAYSSALSQAQIRQNYNFTKPNYPNGYDGLLGGGTTSKKPTWNSGGYFTFDGSNDEVSLNSGNTIPASTFNNCTFEYWIKLDNLLETRHLYFHDYTSNNVNLIGLSRSNTNNKLMVFGSTGHINIARGNTDLVANIWTHIAVTLTSSQLKIYINGQLDATVSQSFNGFSNPLYGTIGVDRTSQSATGNKWLDGQMSKFRVYDTALTGVQIEALYSEGR